VEVAPTVDQPAPPVTSRRFEGWVGGRPKSMSRNLNVNAESFQKLRTAMRVNVEPERAALHDAGGPQSRHGRRSIQPCVNLQGTHYGCRITLGKDGYACDKKKRGQNEFQRKVRLHQNCRMPHEANPFLRGSVHLHFGI